MMKHRFTKPLVALTLLVAAGEVRGQERERRITVVAGPEYDAGSFQRLFLGDNWRDVWTTPLQVPVLDLSSFAGGLEPERQGGGNQSRTLHMLDAEGNGWVFRSINKFPEQGLPPEVSGSPLGAIIGDQISALLPASSLVLPRLLDAAGILHLEPQWYVMPDDPRLGEHRSVFAGMVGGLEFKPNEGEDDSPGWAGSRKIKDSDAFLADLEESPDYRVDAHEFLTARLIDFLVGDTDRGTDQWRWARFGPEGDFVYRPIPRDRDWAFVRADGLVLPLSRPLYPKTTAFGDAYPSIETLTFSSHILDRRLLTRLTRPDFAAAAANLQARLTDVVIAEAVSALPPEYETEIGAELRAHLATRRDALPAMAQRYYDWLATDVDVHGTDEPDRAAIEQRADGSVVVRLSRPGTGVAERNGNSDGESAAVYFERAFLPEETGEVRIHLHGGADLAQVIGVRGGPIVVRVIGGAGDDRIEDRTGRARLYDQAGDNTFARAAGTTVDTRPWYPPEAPEGFRAGGDWAPDWGGDRSLFSPAFDYGEGAGVIVGGGPSFTRYGFRRLPYRWSAQAQALYAIGDGSFGARIDGDYRFENSRRAFTLSARAVQFDAFRFYGYGNDTPELDTDVTRVMQDRVLVHPALAWHLGPQPGRTGEEEADAPDEDAAPPPEVDLAESMHLSALSGTLSVGPILQWTRSTVPVGNPLRATSAEARFNSGQVGARGAIDVARTDRAGAPRRGFRLRAEASVFPAVWDAGGAFGTAEGQVSGYLPLVGATHLAARVGGAGAFGDFPVFESAFVGGRHSLRGFRSDRFAGDAALFGGAELRVPLGTVPLLVNGELGVFGLADAARVWHSGESPGGWHTGIGAGLWFTALGRAVSVAYARGESGRLYAWAGLPF